MKDGAKTSVRYYDADWLSCLRDGQCLPPSAKRAEVAFRMRVLLVISNAHCAVGDGRDLSIGIDAVLEAIIYSIHSVILFDYARGSHGYCTYRV